MEERPDGGRGEQREEKGSKENDRGTEKIGRYRSPVVRFPSVVFSPEKSHASAALAGAKCWVREV